MVIPNKEELDRGNQIETTTTAVVVVEPICAALSNYVSTVEQVALEKLVAGCHKEAPDATAEEIIFFIEEKGEVMSRMRERSGDFATVPKVQNPMGFLLRTVPQCFAGEAFRLWRKRRAATGKKSAATADWAQEADENLQRWLNSPPKTAAGGNEWCGWGET
jgi:hypothetical protein